MIFTRFLVEITRKNIILIKKFKALEVKELLVLFQNLQRLVKRKNNKRMFLKMMKVSIHNVLDNLVIFKNNKRD